MNQTLLNVCNSADTELQVLRTCHCDWMVFALSFLIFSFFSFLTLKKIEKSSIKVELTAVIIQ